MKTMKNFIPVLLTLLLPFVTSAQSGLLHVKVDGVEAQGGALKILLFNNEEAFPNDEQQAFFKVTKELNTTDFTQTFNIPFGAYAVVVYLDENNNDKYDRAWLGRSCEQRAFSMLENEDCRKPSFYQSAFQFDKDGMKVEISFGQPGDHKEISALQ